MFKFRIDPENSSLREGMAISNLDGRLWGEVGKDVGRYFGDEAMVRARIGIEARYLIALSKVGVVRKLSVAEEKILLSLHTQITPEIYDKIREIESKARHDLVAVTIMFKELLLGTSLQDVVEYGWVHLGLTTWDIDNPARSCLIASFIHEVYLPAVSQLLVNIADLSERTKDVIVVGKTHLQPATPTILGKEIALFGVRIGEVSCDLKDFKLRGKLTGAVGNLSAHKAVYPNIDWKKFSRAFIESLGLEANIYTTQIEPRSKKVELIYKMQLINNILVDFSQDMRLMIGFDWLAQEVRKEEFGSSAMPQKVNPIDFENAQGNALFANWVFEGLARQLPVSWLQRDLVDKTIQRNFGVPFGHSLIAIISTSKGLKRIGPNEEKLKHDLESDWSILSEAFQTYLRSKGRGDAYDTLKEFTRGKQLSSEDIRRWIDGLAVNGKIKKDLKKLTPTTYVGYAKENTVDMIAKIRDTVSSIASL